VRRPARRRPPVKGRRLVCRRLVGRRVVGPLLVLAFVLPGPRAAAQRLGPLEVYVPGVVLDSADAYVRSLPPAERGAPFLILRMGWGDADPSEVAVMVGPRSPTDSLLLAEPGRTAPGNRDYGVAFAGEAYGSRYVVGSHATIQMCILEARAAYVIRFVELRGRGERKTVVRSTRMERVLWCMAGP